MKKIINAKNTCMPLIGWAAILTSLFFTTSCGGGNSNNTTTAADSNTVKMNSQPTSTKDQLLGTWIQQESGTATVKMVFAKEEAIRYNNGQKEGVYTYQWLNDKELEMDVNGMKIISVVTINGDELVMDTKEMGPVKYKRDNGNATTDGSSSGSQPASKLLVGKWARTVDRTTTSLEFLANGKYVRTQITTFEDPQFGPDQSKHEYKYTVTNENTVEIIGAGEKASFKIEDNGEALLWTINGATDKYQRIKSL